MAIKIEMLRCFCTVVQTGNLAEAADRLGRTQSALSMSLKQLEEHLGKKLFEGERKNALSPVGEQIFELARKQIRQFDETIQSIEMEANTNRGLIRIVSVPSVAALVFPGVLEHMTTRFPGIKVELRDTDTQEVIDALTESKADIGIASGYHPLNNVTATLLLEDKFGIICAADHPLAHQDVAPTIKEVVTESFVRNALCDLIQTPEFKSALDATNITVQNTYSLITMVRTGRWVTVLPQTVVQSIPDTVVFRAISDLPDKRQVVLYQRDRTRFKELAEECSRFIAAQDFS